MATTKRKKRKITARSNKRISRPEIKSSRARGVTRSVVPRKAKATAGAKAGVRVHGLAAYRAVLETSLLDGRLEGASGAPMTRLEALRAKLAALGKIEIELTSRLTGSASDQIELQPNINAIRGARATVEAQIAAATTPQLPPPSEADVTALVGAIRDAETAIARNAKVNELVKAASALIRMFKM